MVIADYLFIWHQIVVCVSCRCSYNDMMPIIIYKPIIPRIDVVCFQEFQTLCNTKSICILCAYIII